MYSEHTNLEMAGQLMIAALFLGTALINSLTQVKQHAERMRALGVPWPYLSLWAGFAIQYVGGVLVLLDTYTNLGASLLIAFTVLATIIFHRYWLTSDLLMRHIHKSIIFSNIGIIGALLLLF